MHEQAAEARGVRARRLCEIADRTLAFSEQVGNAEPGCDVDRLGDAKAANESEEMLARLGGWGGGGGNGIDSLAQPRRLGRGQEN